MPFKPLQVARWLNDILDNVILAQTFVGELDRAAFCADTLRVYAVTRCLEIISEASRRLPDDLKGRHPSIAWRWLARAAFIGTITKRLTRTRCG
jgi:uncharacterized protein with HEPN domain